MRIIFMGSPQFAVPTLNALVGAGHDLVAVYCQPPRAAGRGRTLRATPVQQRAESLGIPVRSPRTLRDEAAQAEFASWNADVAVVAAYGLILPQPVLDAPPLGCINVHASLLPRWRGAAPIQRAILAGEEVTGVTIMQMEAGLDTGPMLLAADAPIGRSNAGELTERLGEIGAALIVLVLEDLPAFPPTPQPEGASYAPKIAKAEARIDWAAEGQAIERQVRAFAPSPGAWFAVGDERVRILAAERVDASGAPGEVLDAALTIACGRGALRPTLVQRAGRGAMMASELLRGFPIPAGTRLE